MKRCFLCGKYGATEREVWADIPGYEGIYRVSTNGRIMSLRGAPQIMNSHDNGNGYLYITLCKNGMRKNHYVHRLVADAFCIHPYGKDYVNHINHIKQDNRSSNLEWCTQRENVQKSAHLMRHPKSVCTPTKTGEKYIGFHKDKGKMRYRVCIENLRICKHFDDLEDAVAYRNEVINK